MLRMLLAGFFVALTACANGGPDGASPIGDSGLPTALQGTSGDGAIGTPVASQEDDSGSAARDSASSQSDSRAAPVRDAGLPGVDAAAETGEGEGAPTTCAEANGVVGCCGPNGEAYFCASASSTTVKTTTCTGGKVCGWDESKMYYTCVSPPGGGDPSGTEPMACGGGPVVDAGTTPDSGGDGASPPDASDATPGDATVSGADAHEAGPVADSGEAGPDEDAADATGMDAPDTQPANQTPTTCAQADGVVGCCGPNGDVYYCASGNMPVVTTSCGASKVCGWNASKSYYDCVAPPATADPSGTHPMACQ